MVKILDSVTGAIRGPKAPQVPQAPQVEPPLRAAEARLAELDAQHGDLALADVLGSPGAADDLARWRTEIAAQRELVAGLQAAYRVAKEHDDAATSATLKALRASQVRAVAQHLRARDTAAAALSAALAEACRQFKTMVERAEKAQAACPLGSTWPMGSQCGFGELRALVEAEIFRLGGDGTLVANRSFPGARCLDPRQLNQPAAITPISDALTRVTDYTLSVLKGEPAVAPSAPEPAEQEADPLEYDPADLSPGTIDATRARLS